MFKIFPWDNDEKPFFVNPEGFEWYIDKSTTDYCYNERLNNLPPLNAVVFYVVKEIDGEKKPLSRVLVDKKTNKVLADETSLEGMGSKIDFFRLAQVADDDEYWGNKK